MTRLPVNCAYSYLFRRNARGRVGTAAAYTTAPTRASAPFCPKQSTRRRRHRCQCRMRPVRHIVAVASRAPSHRSPPRRSRPKIVTHRHGVAHKMHAASSAGAELLGPTLMHMHQGPRFFLLGLLLKKALCIKLGHQVCISQSKRASGLVLLQLRPCSSVHLRDALPHGRPRATASRRCS